MQVLTTHEPWSAWRDEGNEPGDDAEDDLDHIAEAFAFSRENRMSVMHQGFPVRLTRLPDSFCRFCLRWFK